MDTLEQIADKIRVGGRHRIDWVVLINTFFRGGKPARKVRSEQKKKKSSYCLRADRNHQITERFNPFFCYLSRKQNETATFNYSLAADKSLCSTINHYGWRHA